LKALWKHLLAEKSINQVANPLFLCNMTKRFGCVAGSMGAAGLWLDVWNAEGTTGKVGFPQNGQEI
jgi:hypothetical protein